MSVDTYYKRVEQAKAAAAKFGRALKRGDCHTARKHRAAYLKAVGQAMDIVGKNSTVRKLDDATPRMDARLERCAVKHDYISPGASSTWSRR